MDKIRKSPNLRFCLRFFKTVGIWSIGVPNKKLYYTWTFACNVFFTALYLMAMIANLLIAYKINDLYIVLAEFAMFGKMMCILVYHERINVVLRRLHYKDSFVLNEEDPEETKIIAKKMKMYFNIATIYQVTSLSAAVMGWASAFSDPPKMSFPAWYPFGLNDISVDMHFYIVFLYQNIGMLGHCFMNCCWDNFFVYLMTNIQVQFELLNYRLVRDFQDIKRDNRGGKKLKDVFVHFTEIMSVNEEVEEMFGMAMFLQFNMSAAILCTTTILIINVSPVEYPAEFLLYIFFEMAMISQILLPCYFGNEITIEFNKIRDAIYNTNWLDMEVKDRKLLISFMERLKRPAKITANSFFGLSLSTFTKVG